MTWKKVMGRIKSEVKKNTNQRLVKQELNERNPIKTINTGVIPLAVYVMFAIYPRKSQIN